VDPSNNAALQALLALKKRDPTKGFIMVAASIDALLPWMEPVTPDMAGRILPTWPGPCTWVVPAKPGISPLLRGKHATLAVRVTTHPVMKALCEAFGGALVSTSAYREGEAPARTLADLEHAFGAQCPAVLLGVIGELSAPTPIYDGVTGLVIRQSLIGR
jgi:L-threonylcarbamoyladenylate synthase